MKTILALTAAVVLSAGCQTVDPVAVQNAEVYFAPRFKYVEEPRFCFDRAERERALQEVRKLEANTLFEFVIDSKGKVRQARLVKTDQPKHRHEDILAHARVMVFSEDADDRPYRAFYFPTSYTYEAKFEWLHQ